VVLAIDPVSLVGVSFQMSFGAVVALIAVYETFGARLATILHGRSLLRQLGGYCGAVVVTTLVATIGTLPFSVYHFHRLALFSPLANVVAVPVSAAWTLPWGVAACLLMPFGLEHIALVPMGWGIDLTIWVAVAVSSLPGCLGDAALADGRARNRSGGRIVAGSVARQLAAMGTLAIIAGLASMALTRPPDVVIADNGRFVALRAADGHYFAASGHDSDIVGSFLAEDTGEALSSWPSPTTATARLDCAGELCRYEARGRRVAIVTGSAALPLDCSDFDAILAQVPAGVRCRSTIPVIDRIDSWRLGAVALWLDPRGIAIASANESRGDRPWVPHPRRHQVWGGVPPTPD
jgi:competence protein ComEC